MGKIEAAIVVGVDEHNGIGKDGGIPWHVSDDFLWFKTLTTYPFVDGVKNAVVMGRKTWESLRRPGSDTIKPLPNRINVVVTSNPQAIDKHNMVLAVPSLEGAYRYLSSLGVGKVFIIGGEMVYNQAINTDEVTELYITHLPGVHGCDTFFPLVRCSAEGFNLRSTLPPFGESGLHIDLHTRYNSGELKGKVPTDHGILIDKVV